TSILDYIFRELAVSYLDRTDLAHVKPQGASFDDLGRGDEEGKRNIAPVTDDAASRGLEVLRQISSTGYLRKRVPQELVVLKGGMATASTLALYTGAVATMAAVQVSAAIEPAIDARARARMQGYEGDSCGECGNFTLVRNGTCMKCNTCGATSGCS
ncbi:MAG: vitamin B12-dependent ribonucleotide reductase, partial [Alphaproteobacteria bacterium]|nr:vitamin B12-dependent ribonucleotide reductase [Alphaproteobacteria bacterium]